MSRVSVLESMYSRKRSSLEFNYDMLWAPPIRSILTQDDINTLYHVATSLKYNGNINKKYEIIDSVMVPRGFQKAHSGTNRVVYNFLDDTRFVAKIALDKAGIKDNPAEFKNQEYFKPFCCKIFEVDPTGVIGFIERVNPITSLEEFLSVSDDIFNMIITKIIGKYVVDDIGTSKFLNFGLRLNGFGPVILDFPYAYELDGAKLYCQNKINGTHICNGEIDYDEGFNYLRCNKCGKTYQARDLALKNKEILILNDKGGPNYMNKVRLVDGEGNVILSSDSSTKTYATKEQFISHNSSSVMVGETVVVGRTDIIKPKSKKRKLSEFYSNLMMETFGKDRNDKPNTPFKDLLSKDNSVKVAKTEKNTENVFENKTENKSAYTEVIVGKPSKNVEPETEETKVEDKVVVEDKIKIDETTVVDKAIDTIAKSIGEVLSGDNVDASVTYDYKVNDDVESKTEVDETINGKDHIDLSGFTIGGSVTEEEVDYSDYEPIEEESKEDEEEYDSESLNENYKFKDRKQSKKKVSFNDDDMSEY